MRIADIMKIDTYVKYDRIRQEELEKYNKQIASGKKVLVPSNDVIASVSALRLKKYNAEIDSFLRNMDFVSNIQSLAESALDNVVKAGQEVRVEIVRLLNTGVLDKEDANIIKEYLTSMRDYIIKEANISIGDTRLFGGVKSQTDPFDSNGVYQGDNIETTAPVAKGTELNTTFDGSKYFGVDTANGNKMAIVEAIDKIIEIIDGASASPPTHSLGELNSYTFSNVTVNGKTYNNIKILDLFDIGLNTVMQYRSVIGSQMKVINDIKTQYQSNKVNNNELISNLEDADMPESITKLYQVQTAYQALIASYNQNKDLSLLKYYK
ncbi:hypothetical protein JCM14244_08630 [Venenivibrio stagnispumantis]|uniref:Flagellar hook-associated protein 3 FlgL n=1 Tax=Venenivibrio stagnispumantis TaxID=407998 RepID=A0AA45WLM5_9AQUI|nr:flagellar hook protein [Venenivibrio stagnispumantis]MCW4573437.1 flagellar hook protein [Venenivibrio stagnispumantis]SMP11950.1 flagellar hook-associated protein 3 FlgL [Venenivibrio stagnispumantis]